MAADELWSATKSHDHQVIDQLLKNGADPFVPGQSGESAFELSVYNSEDDCDGKETFQELTKLFLENLRPPGLGRHTKLNTEGLPPLCWAARHNAVDVTRYLLDRGEDVNQQSLTGMSPLHYSAKWGCEQTCALLLKQKNI